jgi:SAM-dependent methyltransferase
MGPPLADPKRIVAQGYDRLGPVFGEWVAENPPAVRAWFLGEVLARLDEGSDVLELGCGPGTAAVELSAAGRRYVGVDLSGVQLFIARRRVPKGRFVRADFTSIAFRPSSSTASCPSTSSTTCRGRSSPQRSGGSTIGFARAAG